MSGLIAGTIVDSSGATIPGASLTLVHTSTKVARHTNSDGAGNFRIVERMQLRVRIEAYNAFNHTQFSAVNTSAQFNPATGAQTNSAFGSLTTARSPRTVQLGARVTF